MIEDLSIRQFISPCSDGDTVSFRVELVRAALPDRIDSIRDFHGDALASSPIIHIPYYPTPVFRAFFSSTERLQGNSWDDFVTVLNEQFLSGDAFVIRFVHEPGSGILVLDNDSPTRLRYSLNSVEENDFLDIGSPSIRWLAPEEAAAYPGLILRGKWKRDWGTHDRLQVYAHASGPNAVAFRFVLVPLAMEETLHGSLLLGVEQSLLETYPRLTFVMNGEGEVTCRADSLTLRP